jgi:hypothetical protein
MTGTMIKATVNAVKDMAEIDFPKSGSMRSAKATPLLPPAKA